MADRNYISHADVYNVRISQQTYPAIGTDPLEFSDTLKLSNAKNVLVEHCEIEGGQEDCVDMNRYCENVTIENCTVYPNGKYGFTIKGGSKNITLRNIVFDGHGSEVDIDLGNWSDQAMEKTQKVWLENITSKDGSPVRVRVLWADRPTVIAGDVKVIVIPKCFVWIYRWLRARKLVA